MEAEGQKTATNPSAMLAGLLTRRAKLHDELRNIEKQVYDMETNYLQDPSQCGNVLKGFEGFLSASKSTALLKRSRKFQLEDRLFSLSSVTSPAVAFPRLFRIANSKGFFISQCKPVALRSWNLRFRRNLAEVDVEEWASMENILSTYTSGMLSTDSSGFLSYELLKGGWSFWKYP